MFPFHLEYTLSQGEEARSRIARKNSVRNYDEESVRGR